MTRLRNILIMIAACMIAATSCIEDGYTTSSTDVPQFSCDTLSFDTVFTDFNTPTKQFVVYNRNKKQLKISEISLGNGSDSHFYINVDGQKGTTFHDVTVRGEDSIYIFVESRLNANGQNAPLKVEDCINFTTNGVQQKVVLTAWGQDVQRIYRTNISADTHFTADKPYVLFDTLFVDAGATLTIDAGATLYFHDKAAMQVNGTLLANGTQQQPINLRGDRTDYLFDGANYDIMSGQWGGITFGSNSYGNEMSYVLMRGMSDGVTVNPADSTKRALHIFNSVLRNSSGSVLTARNAHIEAEGCEIADASKEVMVLEGGKYTFTNCTIGNYYLFGIKATSIIDIVLSDSTNTAVHPNISFNNCIVCGNVSELSKSSFTGENIFFRNCMLHSTGSDDSNFLQCKWGGDAMFRHDREKYIFDYRLGNESNAIAIGNVSLCPDFATTDRYGQERIYNGTIDAGAYRWTTVPTE